MKGSFSEDALLSYAQQVSQAQPVDFAEGDTYDFTRCMRSNGSFYGTSGKCKSGTEAGAKEQAASKGARSQTAAKPHGGMRDSTVAESRKAMKYQEEQMNMHGNQIAELEESGQKVPPALRAAYNQAKASYNSHRKAINEAVGVEKRPVMQAAREAGRAAEKKEQEKRALQRGEEAVARASAEAENAATRAKETRSRIDNLKEELKRGDADKPFVKSEITRLERTAKELESRARGGARGPVDREARVAKHQAAYDAAKAAHDASKAALAAHRGRDARSRALKQPLASKHEANIEKLGAARDRLIKAKVAANAAKAKAKSTPKK